MADMLGKADTLAVRSNVSETESEVCITAELPRIEIKNVDVSVTGNRNTVKGKKKFEQDEKKEEKGREYHRIERVSGSFFRAMSMPFEIDPDSVKAEAKDGVLTVTTPKPPEAATKTKNIEVKKSA